MEPPERDPKRKAVALKYEPDQDKAPRLTAKGEGYMADRILELAMAYGIEVSKEPDLVEVLAALEVDSVIPVEAYAAVAEILSYVYKANAAAGQRLNPEGQV